MQQDNWTWVSENRATFPDLIGYCEDCGAAILEGNDFVQGFCDDGAGGETDVLVCSRCVEAAEDEARKRAVRDEVQAKAAALINASINAPSPFARHARILLGEDY